MGLLLFGSFETAAAPLPVPPPSVFVSAFTELVARVDAEVYARLGGEPVIYQPEVGDPVPITGVFDELYVLVKADPDAGVEVLGPAVFLRLEDVPADPELDDPTLTIRGRDYQVIERRPDSVGGIVLALRLVVE